MSARSFGSADELRESVGVDLEPSSWFRIGQQRIDAFAEATGDHQWIHTDPDRAAHGPYGTTIAHGYLTLSLSAQLSAEVYDFAFGKARINYGLERVRFPAPVPVGSRVRLHCRFEEVLDKPPNSLLARARLTFELEGHDKPACVADKLTLLLAS